MAGSAAKRRNNPAALVALATVVTLATPRASAAQDRAMEYAVKAAYLYKFAPFVEWSPRAFASATGAFNLCILGRDPFGASLDRAVSGQKIEGRPVTVRRLDRVDAASGCHILYLGASRAQSINEALHAVRGTPTLTVSDSVGDAGAVIRFIVKNNRVQFDIDTSAAAANGVTISSKLLSLAMSARGGGGA